MLAFINCRIISHVQTVVYCILFQETLCLACACCMLVLIHCRIIACPNRSVSTPEPVENDSVWLVGWMCISLCRRSCALVVRSFALCNNQLSMRDDGILTDATAVCFLSEPRQQRQGSLRSGKHVQTITGSGCVPSCCQITTDRSVQHACKPDFWFYSAWSIAQYGLMNPLRLSIKLFMLVCSDYFFSFRAICILSNECIVLRLAGFFLCVRHWPNSFWF